MFWKLSQKQLSLTLSAVDSCTRLYAPRGDLSLVSVFYGSEVELIGIRIPVAPLVNPQVPLSSATCTIEHTMLVALIRTESSNWHVQDEWHKSSWLIIGIARFLHLKEALLSIFWFFSGLKDILWNSMNYYFLRHWVPLKGSHYYNVPLACSTWHSSKTLLPIVSLSQH